MTSTTSPDPSAVVSETLRARATQDGCAAVGLPDAPQLGSSRYGWSVVAWR